MFANRLVPAIDPLSVTIGDEFQGLYSTVDEAVAATLIVQLKLGHDRVRFGVGSGSLSVYDRARTPYSQDGPVWWAARNAIDELGDRYGQLRTVYISSVQVRRRDTRRNRSEPPRTGPRTTTWWEQPQLPGLEDGLPPERTTVYFDMNALINALLAARDALLSRFDDKDNAVALGLIEGRTQAEIGHQLGISQSAVSQRIGRSGVDLLAEGYRMLTGERRS